jgi:SanA protein
MLVAVVIAAFLLLAVPRLVTGVYAQSRLYQVSNAPQSRVAIVFGAGLRWNGEPSPVLRHRVEAASDLYFAGKVEKLLMSGDNRFVDYNEPAAMRNYALELGVPEDAIVMDFAGRRTYDTCYRARDIFQVDDAILVTQEFHLPRAIFTCNALGVPSVGVSADQNRYRRSSLLVWSTREVPATLVAMVELYLTRPEPVLGNPEPIFTNLQ